MGPTFVGHVDVDVLDSPTGPLGLLGLISQFTQFTLFTSDHDGAQHQREPLSWQSRLKIAGEIAHAISYLHTAFSRPIVHRDIKPGNVFLDQHDVAKLTEFSLSISIPEGETHVEDDVCGTALFLCPNYATTSYIT